MKSRPAILRLHDWSFWHYQILGWTLFVAVHMTVNISVMGWKWPAILSLSLQFLAGFLLTLGLRKYYRTVPFRTIGLPALVVHILAASFVTTIVWYYCWFGIEYAIFGEKLLKYMIDPFRAAQVFAISFPDKVAWSTLYFGIKLWKEWVVERRVADAATESAHQAQLQMLRYQLNPHFLFNALNSVRALIDENARSAKQMITDLSEFLRYSLVNRDNAPVTLKNELDAIRLYLAIEQQRYEDKLHATVSASHEAEGWMIPSFTIQPLVEHALRAALQTSPLPVSLDVQATTSGGMVRIVVRQSGAIPAAEMPVPEAEHHDAANHRLEKRLQDAFDGRASLHIMPQEGHVLFELEIHRGNGELHEEGPARPDR